VVCIVVFPIDPHEFVRVVGRDVCHLPPQRGPDILQEEFIGYRFAKDLFGGVSERRHDETDGIDQRSVEVEQDRTDG